ncbi:hypothetical protein AZ013_002084, partial [Citrobacter freundii]
RYALSLPVQKKYPHRLFIAMMITGIWN